MDIEQLRRMYAAMHDAPMSDDDDDASMDNDDDEEEEEDGDDEVDAASTLGSKFDRTCSLTRVATWSATAIASFNTSSCGIRVTDSGIAGVFV